MKRNKFLTLATVALAPVTALTPMLVATSCNSKQKQEEDSKTKLLNSLQELTLNEFKKMCQIPHSSDRILWKDGKREQGNVWNMSCYLRQRAADILGVPAEKIWQDDYGNLVIDIPATDAEYNDYPTVAVQAHMDMVFSFDPTKYPEGETPDPKTTKIDLVEEVINGKRILHSRDYKTTIGADDGMGVATIFALMQTPEVKHGKIRAIITNCEENAMQGAKMMIVGGHDTLGRNDIEDRPDSTYQNVLKEKNIKNVINIDGAIDGNIVVACSGGIGSHYFNTLKPLEGQTKANKFKLTIDGFTGGHSGGAPRSHRGNPIKIAMEILNELNADGNENNIELASISTPGCKAYNKVGYKCIVEFATDKSIEDVQNTFQTVYDKHKLSNATEEVDELGEGKTISIYYNDMNMSKWTVDKLDSLNKVASAEDSSKIVQLHKSLRYGYINPWKADTGKSSSNVGPTTMSWDGTAKGFSFKTSSYSRSDDEKIVNKYFASNLASLEKIKWTYEQNANYECDAKFPEWKETKSKKLYNLTAEGLKAAGFKEKDIKPDYIHGGVECSWWMRAFDPSSTTFDGECTCIGVNVVDEHEPTESVDVESIKQNFIVLNYMLQHANELE